MAMCYGPRWTYAAPAAGGMIFLYSGRSVRLNSSGNNLNQTREDALKYITVIVCAAMIAGTAHASPLQAKITETYVGCPKPEDVRHLGQLLDKKEGFAATVYALDHCPVILKAGTKVLIEKNGVGEFGEAECVRPEDQTTCVWTFADVVGAAQ